MRFRLFRSRAFWFGLPGLVFLLWAWGLSRTHWSSIEFSSGSAGGAVLGQMDGEAFFVCQGSPDWRNAEGRHLPLTSDPAYPLKRTLEQSRSHGEFSCFVPHWLLMLLYLLSWSGVVAWRWRKYRRARSKLPRIRDR